MNDQLSETLNGILQNVNAMSPEVVQQTIDYGIFLHSMGIKIGCFMVAIAIIFTIWAIIRGRDDGFQAVLVIVSIVGWCGLLVTILNYINLSMIHQAPLTYVIQQLT